MDRINWFGMVPHETDEWISCRSDDIRETAMNLRRIYYSMLVAGIPKEDIKELCQNAFNAGRLEEQHAGDEF